MSKLNVIEREKRTINIPIELSTERVRHPLIKGQFEYYGVAMLLGEIIATVSHSDHISTKKECVALLLKKSKLRYTRL